MKRIMLLALAAGGCTMDLPRKDAPAVDPVTSAGCDAAEATRRFAGRPAANAEAARVAAGANTVRVVRPGDVVTMDYRGDRLTVELDAAGLIATARCG